MVKRMPGLLGVRGVLGEAEIGEVDIESDDLVLNMDSWGGFDAVRLGRVLS